MASIHSGDSLVDDHTVQRFTDTRLMDALGAGLASDSQVLVHDGVDKSPLALAIYDGDGHLLAGLHAEYFNHWLYIKLLWVNKPARGQGLGTRLMEQIEDEALELGLDRSYLCTYSYQAPDFYQKLGYREFARLEDCPVHGEDKIYLAKPLKPVTIQP